MPLHLHRFVYWRSLGPTPVSFKIQVHMMLSRGTYARNAFAHATINTFRFELSRCVVSRSARTFPFFCEPLDGQRWSCNVPPSSSASCFASASGRANSDFSTACPIVCFLRIGTCPLHPSRSFDGHWKSGLSNVGWHRNVADRYSVLSVLLSAGLRSTPSFDVSLGRDTLRLD